MGDGAMGWTTQFAWYMTGLLGLVVMGWVANSISDTECFLNALSKKAYIGGYCDVTPLLALVSFCGGIALYCITLAALFSGDFVKVLLGFQVLFLIGAFVPAAAALVVGYHIGVFTKTKVQ